jgi:hypothetical protein
LYRKFDIRLVDRKILVYLKEYSVREEAGREKDFI